MDDEALRPVRQALDAILDGLAPRVRNLPEWGPHITEHLRSQVARSPDPSLEELLAELEGYLPPLRTVRRRRWG